MPISYQQGLFMAGYFGVNGPPLTTLCKAFSRNVDEYLCSGGAKKLHTKLLLNLISILLTTGTFYLQNVLFLGYPATSKLMLNRPSGSTLGKDRICNAMLSSVKSRSIIMEKSHCTFKSGSIFLKFLTNFIAVASSP